MVDTHCFYTLIKTCLLFQCTDYYKSYEITSKQICVWHKQLTMAGRECLFTVYWLCLCVFIHSDTGCVCFEHSFMNINKFCASQNK